VTEASHHPQPPPRHNSTRGYSLGLLYGIVLSGITWGGAFAGWFDWIPSSRRLQVLLFLLLSLKAISIAVVLYVEAFRARRGAGAGILTSVGIGALIFFGLCAANFKI